MFRKLLASSGGGTFGQNNPQASQTHRLEAAMPAAEDVLAERPARAPHASASERQSPPGSVSWRSDDVLRDPKLDLFR